MTNSIYHDLGIIESIEKVFAAITNPEHLIRWWPLKCDGIPKENEICNFYFTPDYDWFGKVITIEDNTALHIKMTKSDPDWNSTTFGFDLEKKNDRVLLQFWHVGCRM